MHIALLLLFSAQVYDASTAIIITKLEFNTSVTSNGYPAPREEIYDNFAENTGNFSRDEAAMLIAQLIHESGGFQFTKQLGMTTKKIYLLKFRLIFHTQKRKACKLKNGKN